MFTPDPTHAPRELDARESDGIRVRLLWHPADRVATVEVRDGRTGAAFSVEIRENDDAYDVFHHPFAYAAWRGVDAHDEHPAAPASGAQRSSGGETQVGVRASDS